MKKILLLILTSALLSACVSCGSNSADTTVVGETEVSSSVQTDGENTQAQTDAETDVQTGDAAEEDPTGAESDEVFTAEQFGAVGDGKTDDGPALTSAVNAAAKAHGILRLGEGKTYYVATSKNTANGFTSPFAITGKTNFTIDGGGSTISVRPGITYLAIVGCKNAVIKNLNFDYNKSVYMVGTVKNVAGNTVTFTTDIEPNTASCNFNGIGFSIKYNAGIQNRPHAFFSTMKKTSSKTVEVTYGSTGMYAVGDKVFLPNPNIGHMIGEVVYIGGNKGDIMLQNVNLYQAPSFTCAVKSNTARIIFDNFNLTPSPDNDREIKMVAWRDGFHCKDNRSPIIWRNCTVGVIFDDVCNISSTLGQILSVKSDTVIEVTNQEFYKTQGGRIIGYDCKKGDVLDIYSLEGGVFCGQATVTAIKKASGGALTLTLDKLIEGMRAGYVTGNRMTCAPGSVMDNCNFQGTYRFRGDCTVKNSNLGVLMLWIMVEGDVEGPIPRSVVFEKCTFTGGQIQIGALNRSTGRTLQKVAAEINGVTFRSCTFNDTRFLKTGKLTYTVEK